MNPRDLSDHREYVPGRGVEEVARERGIDPDDLIVLSSNENELGPSPHAVAAIREAAPRANRYPKSSHMDLTAAIAERWSVTPAQIWLANGGDGALDYISRAMLSPGEDVLVSDPGFAYYGMSARFHHAGARSYRLEKASDFELTPETVLSAYNGERIVYLTSPHNPTGGTISPEEVATIADGTDESTLVVVDEAYGAFAETPGARPLVSERDDVAILRSFSKSYGLAGLRLGYAIVPEAWADAYRRVNTPFAAGEIACRAGLAALEDEEHLERTISTVRSGRRRIRDRLDTKTWPSEGNFVLASVGDAERVADALMDRGVITRDCSSFGLPECIRITVTEPGPLDRAIDTMNEVIADPNRVSSG